MLHLNFHHRVYVRHKTHTYLWVKDTDHSGYFLTMESGTIEQVRASRSGDQYQVSLDGKDWYLEPLHPDNFEKALKVYSESTLEKSNQAQQILESFFGPADPAQRDTPRKRLVKPSAAPTTITGLDLKTICKEMGIDPGAARRALRGKVNKPGGTWAWPNREALEPVLAILEQLR